MKNLFGMKTFWVGLGLIGFGIFTAATGDVERGITMMFEGLGLITLRQGVATVATDVATDVAKVAPAVAQTAATVATKKKGKL